jgi:DNA repair protein RadD
LTTGFDEPGIDMIVLLRPTCSPVFHVQTLGRGGRIDPSKTNCLVLDFAGNTERLGPINNVVVNKKSKGKEGGDPITKTCPECNSILPPAVKFCPDCNYEFLFAHGLSATAANYDIIEDGDTHWLPVDRVSYDKHVNIGTPTSVKVTYHCGNKKISEWVCIQHQGFAKHKADHWVKYRGGIPCNNADDLILQSSHLKTPSVISVQKKGKYYMVKDAKFENIE